MSKESLLRLKASVIYKTLLKREKKDGFDNQLSSKIEIIVDRVSDLLHRIPENMEEYTLHDSNHSAKIIEIIGKFLPPKTLSALNAIELTLTILSAYLHDIGMTSTKKEREDIISSDVQFAILFKTLSDKKENYEYYISKGEHRSATFIQDQVFTEFLRRSHVQRSSDYIKTNLSFGEMALEVNGIPFWKHLITICDGHGEPVAKIANKRKYPVNTLVGETVINIQFLSLILRLGDILDLDPERTPKIIYEYINPQDPTSILEWKKHRSIIGHSITAEKVIFEGECGTAEVERALKQFINWIEIERKQTMHLLKESNSSYELRLNEEITADRIHSDGSYIYNDLKFEIDYKRVLDLLMGQRLYKSTYFSLRELLQNSIDAIKARERLYLDREEKFPPRITITLSDNELSIEDNGLGMDETTFKKYFLQIGKSYYSSPDFYSKNVEIDVTSEFGIGVLSVFMIATSLKIESRKEPDNPDSTSKPILFEIPTAHSYTIQKKGDKQNIGTIITIKLKSKAFNKFSLFEILKSLIPTPPFPIILNDMGHITNYSGSDKPIIPKLPLEIDKGTIQDYQVRDINGDDELAFSHYFYEVDFSDSDNPILQDIEGTLMLVNSSMWNWYSQIHGTLTQRNFSIGEVSEDSGFKITATTNIKSLLPSWLSYYSTLNLTRSSTLSITPDRTDVIVDEKYNNLKNLIEQHIISKLEDFFKTISIKKGKQGLYDYIDLLLATSFINIDLERRKIPLSNNAREFLSKHISFPVMLCNGDIIRKNCFEIKTHATIGFVERKLVQSEFLIYKESVKDHDVILLVLDIMKYNAGWIHRLEPLLILLTGETYFETGPYISITSILPNTRIEIIYHNGKGRGKYEYNFCNQIADKLSDPVGKVLCIQRRATDSYFSLNKNHPFISVFFDANDIQKPKTDLIFDRIQTVLRKTIEDILLNQQVEGIHAILINDHNFDRSFNFDKACKGIIGKTPDFLTRINKDFSKIWKENQKNGTIEINSKVPKLTASDFPGFWSDSENTSDGNMD
ncbi:ATP-binding protein [Pedobacter sp.]|uniref:HD domain-containing protein n=1 Tax=Pedobacter sp. TaxID=1411316 RepID=UPI0031D68D91